MPPFPPTTCCALLLFDFSLVSIQKGSSVMAGSNDIKGLFTCKCGASVKNRLTCDDCVRTGLLETASSNFNSHKVAEKCGLSYFFSNCETHGISRFTTETNTCQICDPPRGPRARTLARREGRTTYLDTCVSHGPDTIFGVNSGKCLTCYNATGAVRQSQRPGQVRAEARRAGWSRYGYLCPTCGPTSFSVITGKCLTCHTTAGIRRVRPLTP